MHDLSCGEILAETKKSSPTDEHTQEPGIFELREKRIPFHTVYIRNNKRDSKICKSFLLIIEAAIESLLNYRVSMKLQLSCIWRRI